MFSEYKFSSSSGREFEQFDHARIACSKHEIFLSPGSYEGSSIDFPREFAMRAEKCNSINQNH